MESHYTWSGPERQIAYLVDTGCGRTLLLTYLKEEEVANPEKLISDCLASDFLTEVEDNNYRVTAWMNRN